jgi:hypothetical protein
MHGFNLIIKDEATNYNFSSWVNEKLKAAIRGICRISHENLSELDLDNLYNALLYNIVLLSATTGKGKMDDGKVIDFIFNRGIDAFEYVEYIFKLTRYEGAYVKKIKDNDAIDEIMQHITPDKANRTELLSIIAPMKYKNSWVCNIEDDLEDVTMGEKTWDWFYNKHKDDKEEGKKILDGDEIEAIEYIQSLR